MASTVKISPLSDSSVFSPIKVGRNELQHKIVYAPTTRFRSLKDHSPSDLNVQYYSDRTTTKGSLVITEATAVGLLTAGHDNIPGIWTDNHVKAWKKVTDAVHDNKSFISVQAWFLGRRANPLVLKANGQDFVAPSAVYSDEATKKAAIEASNPLREFTELEIHDLIYNVFPNAARKAIEAGFDYFEIHGAHGYLIDTFLNPSSNRRTDKYGGSIENRARFALELIDSISEAIGADRVAIRLAPWTAAGGLKGVNEEVHPVAIHGYLLHELQKRANAGKQLAYISIVEPRVSGVNDLPEDKQVGSNDFIYQIWKGIVLKSGNYTYDAPRFETIKKDTSDHRTLVGFSRYFTSNPDLVDRLYHGYDLEPYDREQFYTKTNWGYNTYGRYGDKSTFDKEIESKRIPKEICVR